MSNNQVKPEDGAQGEPQVRSSALVRLLERGIEAAEGAQVTIEAKYADADQCPYNSDNYCRLLDWMADARRHLKEQANVKVSDHADGERGA